MTEQEWLASTEPARMLAWLTGSVRVDLAGADPSRGILGTAMESSCPIKPSDRKLRLFAAGCYADASGHEPSWDGWQAWAERESEPGEFSSEDGARYAVGLKVGQLHPTRLDAGEKARRASLLRCVFGNPYRSATLCGMDRKPFHDQFAHVDKNGGFWLEAECPVCVPVRAGRVVSLARAAYDERDLSPERLGVLSDALEEAGCPQDSDVLRHLRGHERCVFCGGKGEHSTGFVRCDVEGIHDSRRTIKCVACDGGWRKTDAPHVRGCYVLDTILGLQ